MIRGLLLSSVSVVAAWSALAPPANAATVTLRPVADTYSSSQSPNKTHGSLSYMKTQASPVRNPYLRFKVTNLGAPVVKATLKLYALTSAGTRGVSARRVADTSRRLRRGRRNAGGHRRKHRGRRWGEHTLTYKNAPALGGELSRAGRYGTKSWVAFDVTPQVRGDGLVSVGLSTTSRRKRTFATRESATPPRLVVQTGKTTTTPSPSPGEATTTPSPSPGSSLFSASSYLNSPLPSTAPLDPHSQTMVSDLVSMTQRYAVGINTSSWTTRVYEVPAQQPKQRVVLDQSNPDLQAAFAQVPVPPGALPDAESDRHLVVWQKSSDSFWEMLGAYWSGTTLHFRYGGRMEHVSTNPGHFIEDGSRQHARWGATATSIPLLAGLIRYSEAQALNIPHAIALAVPEQNCEWRNPAQRTDGGCSSVGHVPAGARFRLPANVDVGALSCSPLCRAIARAAQTYGLVVRDQAGAVSMYGENTGADWSSTIPGGKSLAGFPWGQLQGLPPLPG
jgi:hypothetical protein